MDNRVDRSAGTIRVRAVVPNKSMQFTPGLFARVRLMGGEQHQAVSSGAAGTDVVRAMARRAGATITEVAGSHVIMISQPQVVTDVILNAIAAVS